MSTRGATSSARALQVLEPIPDEDNAGLRGRRIVAGGVLDHQEPLSIATQVYTLKLCAIMPAMRQFPRSLCLAACIASLLPSGHLGSTIAAQLRRDPDWARLQPET